MIYTTYCILIYLYTTFYIVTDTQGDGHGFHASRIPAVGHAGSSLPGPCAPSLVWSIEYMI